MFSPFGRFQSVIQYLYVTYQIVFLYSVAMRPALVFSLLLGVCQLTWVASRHVERAALVSASARSGEAESIQALKVNP